MTALRKTHLHCAVALGGLMLIVSPAVLPARPGNPPGLAQEISRVEAEIDQIFADTLKQAAAIPDDPRHRMQQMRILGKLLLFDKQISVHRNTACSFCHMPSAGFTGPISSLNATTVAYPGSVRDANASLSHSRYGHRKPQSYMYAPFYPALHYDRSQQDFYGGNFWDLRATGWKLQSPAAEQAQDPPLDPNEHGLIDSACVVYRLSQRPYRKLFQTVWGRQAFTIHWPPDIEKVCRTPGPPDPKDPFPVHLSPEDRGRSNAAYDQFGLAIAAYEAAPEVSPFSSKFDAALAHPDRPILSKDEQAGWNLFHGKAKCNTCHLDGTENSSGTITPGAAASVAPLFTDFTSANLGLPKNLAVPYYRENKPDRYGYTSNPAGLKFIDRGVGDFLRGPNNPNVDWTPLAKQFDGKFQVPTLRNVDMRPRPDFVKAYMHNGYLKSLKEVVHFYNTRDKFPHCAPGSPGEKVTCWPAPEVPANENKVIGNLGLTDQEENQIVAFMKTLTDGYSPPQRRSPSHQ
jgi:cytochrome c peroxidase